MLHLSPKHQTNLNKGAVAVAFHDLGIWTDNTLDYLPPSVNRAKTYLAEIQHSILARRCELN